MDSAFENVCELDLVFHFDEVSFLGAICLHVAQFCLLSRRPITSSPRSSKAVSSSRRTFMRSIAPVSHRRNCTAYCAQLPLDLPIACMQYKRPQGRGKNHSHLPIPCLLAVVERSVLGVPACKHPWDGWRAGSQGLVRGRPECRNAGKIQRAIHTCSPSCPFRCLVPSPRNRSHACYGYRAYGARSEGHGIQYKSPDAVTESTRWWAYSKEQQCHPEILIRLCP